MTLHDLPALNATFNATATVLLVLGWILIRRGNIKAHRAVMIAALVCSAAFLTSYLIYHYQVGSVRFQGTGAARTIYFTILISHTVLAAVLPFLAVITVVRAVRGKFAKHKAIARWTLPIWLYVSVTGVMVYWMLYRMAF
ncbi:MAG: DUF420 domain-containing protein [Acidobacteriota bacterium]|jgi:uncharacterized membrane protein YozB (DUF420 family)